MLVAWAFRASTQPIFVAMPWSVPRRLRLTDAVTESTIYRCEAHDGGVLLFVPQHRVGILEVMP